MKIRGTFVTRDIAGDIVIVPVGGTALEYNGMISTTATGRVIWEKLEEGVEGSEELVRELTERFDVEKETAEKDVEAFLDQLRKAGFLQE